MASGEAALARLRDAASQVSCHYLVWEDGWIDQLVAEADRAWHAGRSFWAGETDMNAVSVGIEIVNGGHDFGLPPYPPVQVEAVGALAKDICARHGIPAARVLAHSDIAPDRKRDPGEHFPWNALATRGVGLWIAPELAPTVADAMSEPDQQGIAALQARLSRFGYRCPLSGTFDQPTREAVAALQRHWRPTRVDGLPDRSTISALAKVAARA